MVLGRGQPGAQEGAAQVDGGGPVAVTDDQRAGYRHAAGHLGDGQRGQVTLGVSRSIVIDTHAILPERHARPGVAPGGIIRRQDVALATAPRGARSAFAGEGDAGRRSRDDENREIIGGLDARRAQEIIQPIETDAGESVENVLEDLGPKGLGGLGDMPATTGKILPPDHPAAGIHLHARLGHEPKHRSHPNGGRDWQGDQWWRRVHDFRCGGCETETAG